MSLAGSVGDLDQLREFVRIDPGCVHLTGDYDETALLAASLERASLDVLEFLITAGSDVNAADIHGRTVLHLALLSRADDSTAINYILESGADVAASDANGLTPLHWAVRERAPLTVIKNLVSRGAKIDATGANGDTILHSALTGDPNTPIDPAVANYLLSAGADIAARDSKGNTPLHCAAYYKASPAVVETLLNAGASRNELNAAGESAYDLASASGCPPDVLSLLGPRAKSAAA